jgi:hypothetical protein
MNVFYLMDSNVLYLRAASKIMANMFFLSVSIIIYEWEKNTLCG